tara:strand:- start:554 stop:1048 length:495 start_codon:yes stop_codon:yes gene_type:complete
MPTKATDGDSGNPEQSDGVATLESVLAAINNVAGHVETLSDRVVKLEQAPSTTLQTVETPEQLISKLKAGEGIGGRKTIDPQNRKGGYRTDDIVQLMPGDKRDQFIAAKLITEEDDALGVVVNPMYRRKRDDKMKVNVHFPFLGKGKNGEDGIMEDELKLVKAA